GHAHIDGSSAPSGAGQPFSPTPFPYRLPGGLYMPGPPARSALTLNEKHPIGRGTKTGKDYLVFPTASWYVATRMTAAWVRDRAPSLSLATVSALLMVWGDLSSCRAISFRVRPVASSWRMRLSKGVSPSRPDVGRCLVWRRRSTFTAPSRKRNRGRFHSKQS